MADIFFSYASAERELVAPLARALGEHGWTVWWDRQIPPGRTFDEVIEEALEGAKAVVCVWTKQGVASRWVRTEAAEGAARSILLPVLMEDVGIPLAFRRIQAADLTDWEEGQEHDGFNELLAALEQVIGRSSEAVPAMVPEPDDLVGRAIVAGQTRFDEKEWEPVRSATGPTPKTPTVPLRSTDRPPQPQPREEPSGPDIGSDREPSGSIAAGMEGGNRFFRDRRWMAAILTGGALIALVVIVAVNPWGNDPSLGAPAIGSLGCSSIAEMDEPVRCSPAVSNTSGTTVYEWTAADGSPGSGSASTFETSFGSPGTWTIGLSACNGARCDNMSASVSVGLPPSAWATPPEWHDIANSHQPDAWCPAGSFLVAFDIDEVPSWDALDSPAMSRAYCATLSGASSSAWQATPLWMPVGALNSHGQGGDWCDEGMYLVGLDQDRVDGGGGDSPIVGSALCGGPSGSPYSTSEKSWHTVGFTESMTPSGPWCPEGTFMTRFDLDGGADGHSYPIVARVECGRPAQ